MRLAFLFVFISGVLAAQSQGLELTHGIDGGVAYQYDDRMVPPTGLTVEAWITYDDSTIPVDGVYRWPTIARQNVFPNSESWSLRVNASNSAQRQLAFIVRASNNNLYTCEYAFAPSEFLTWTHIAGTFDGQAIRLFKNGIEIQNFLMPILTEVQNNGGELRVGNGDPQTPGKEVWNGRIDELRVWPMARTGPEIASTMMQELRGMPKDVLAFPLNGTYPTEDGTILGAPYGTIQFATGQSSLQPVNPALFTLGPSSTSCLREPQLLVASLPKIGNQAFRLVCVRGPTPATSPAGLLFVGASHLPGLPPILGVTPNIALSSVITSFVQNPPTNQLGNASFQLPIPNQASLNGAAWVFQWIFYDPNCGSQGFTASNGLLTGIQL
jgi:hypothetical protein